MSQFCVALSTDVPHAPNAPKSAHPPTFAWAVTTSGLRMVETILSTMHHAPEAQEGPIPRPAVRSQAIAPCGFLAACEAADHADSRRPFERKVPQLQKLSSGASATTRQGYELVEASTPSRGKVSDVSTWDGCWDGLANAVRVRSPSASSAPLQRTPSAAPSYHPALDLPACAREASIFLG